MFEIQPDQTPKSPIAKIATALAITAVICFGLCTVGAAIANSNGSNAIIITASICGGIVAICFAGLVFLGIITAILQIVKRFRSKGDS